MGYTLTNLQTIQLIQSIENPENPKYNRAHILQEEQSLCFLQALGNIHLGQPRITFPSRFRVAGVGRSMITLY